MSASDTWKRAAQHPARGSHGGAYKLYRPDASPDADPDHPLYGRILVFTGTLQSRTRQMAWESVVKVGGIPSPSRQTRQMTLSRPSGLIGLTCPQMRNGKLLRSARSPRPEPSEASPIGHSSNEDRLNPLLRLRQS
jgi:DNA polymerase-3 subunit epsilon